MGKVIPDGNSGFTFQLQAFAIAFTRYAQAGVLCFDAPHAHNVDVCVCRPEGTGCCLTSLIWPQITCSNAWSTC